MLLLTSDFPCVDRVGAEEMTQWAFGPTMQVTGTAIERVRCLYHARHVGQGAKAEFRYG